MQPLWSIFFDQIDKDGRVLSNRPEEAVVVCLFNVLVIWSGVADVEITRTILIHFV